MSYNGWENYETWLLSYHNFIENWVDLYTSNIDNCKSKKEINEYLNKMGLGNIQEFMHDVDLNSIEQFIQKDFETLYENEIKNSSLIIKDFFYACVDTVNWNELAKAVYNDTRKALQEKLNILDKNQNLAPSN